MEFKKLSFKKLNVNEIAEKITDEKYSLVYINYDRANGIKILSDLAELSDEEKENFYRIYIFNDSFMMTIYKFGEADYRYTEIKKSDFDRIIAEKMVYLEKVKEKKLAVRIGEVAGKEIIQYTRFMGDDE